MSFNEFISRLDIQSISKKYGLYPIIFFFLLHDFDLIKYMPFDNCNSGLIDDLEVDSLLKLKLTDFFL